MTDIEFIGNVNRHLSVNCESGATRTTCRFAACIDFREPGICGPYAGRESDPRLMVTSITCGVDTVVWIDERPVLHFYERERELPSRHYCGALSASRLAAQTIA